MLTVLLKTFKTALNDIVRGCKISHCVEILQHLGKRGKRY